MYVRATTRPVINIFSPPPTSAKDSSPACAFFALSRALSRARDVYGCIYAYIYVTSAWRVKVSPRRRERVIAFLFYATLSELINEKPARGMSRSLRSLSVCIYIVYISHLLYTCGFLPSWEICRCTVDHHARLSRSLCFCYPSIRDKQVNRYVN